MPMPKKNPKPGPTPPATLVVVLAVLLLAPTALAAHAGTPSCTASKTNQLEPGDWVLVTCTGLPVNTTNKIIVDGQTVYEGKSDATGNFEQSIQIPWEVKGGFTKLTVTGGGHTTDQNVHIKGTMDSFVDTFQSLTPLVKITVTLFIIAIPLLLGIWVWRKMSGGH